MMQVDGDENTSKDDEDDVLDKESKKVTVIIDGANVSVDDTTQEIEIARLQNCLSYFQNDVLRSSAADHHHDVHGFVPNFWLHQKDESRRRKLSSENEQLLENLVVRDKTVVLIPSQAHDDLYIIDYAFHHNGFIVTNDMFRDHIGKTFHGKRLTAEWVKNHCIDYTFVKTKFWPNSVTMEKLRRQCSTTSTKSSPKASKNSIPGVITVRRTIPLPAVEFIYGYQGSGIAEFQRLFDTTLVLPPISTLEQMSATQVVPVSLCSQHHSAIESASQWIDNLVSEKFPMLATPGPSISQHLQKQHSVEEEKQATSDEEEVTDGVTKKTIDLSETRVLKMPLPGVEILYGPGGKNLEEFEKKFRVKVVMPSVATLSTLPRSEVISLSILGGTDTDVDAALLSLIS